MVLNHFGWQAIFGVLLLGYIYYRSADNTTGLAKIGLLSFTAIAQIAPAMFGGLIWRRANARGAIAGLTIGFLVWAYLLFLPSLGAEDHSWIASGPPRLLISRSVAGLLDLIIIASIKARALCPARRACGR